MVRAHALLCTLLLFVATVRAEDAPASLARYLPPHTPVFIEARNPTPEEFERSLMGAALEDPGVRRLFDQMFGEDGGLVPSAQIPLGEASLRIRWTRADGSVGLRVRYGDAAGVREFSMDNRFALAWVGLHAAPFPVDLVTALEVRTPPAEVIGTIERIVAAAWNATRGADARTSIDAAVERIFKERTHAGTTYSWGTLGRVQIFLAPLGGSLVVCTTSETRLRDMLDRAADPEAPSLATDPRFRGVRERAGGTGTATTVLTVFVDRGLEAVEAFAPQPVAQVRNVMDTLGLGGLQGFATVARVDGRGVTSTTSLLASGERRGLSRLLAGSEPAKCEALAFAPEETVYVTCGTFHVREIFDIVTEAMGALGQMGPALMQTQFQRAFDLRLREDVLDLLGPEAALIVAPSRGLVPDVALVFDSKDPEKLVANVLSMLERHEWKAGTGVTPFRAGGREAWAVPLLHPALGSVPLSPCIGVVDGKVLVSLFPFSYQRFVAVKDGGEPALTANRAFLKLKERVPDDALGVSWIDVPRLYVFFYDTVMPLVQAMPQQAGSSSPVLEMPRASETLLRHLYGSIGWRTADEHGMHWHAHGPVDTSGFVVGAVSGGAGAGLWIASMRKTARPPAKAADASASRVAEVRQCRSNVRLLRARLLLYRQEHGRLPDSIEELKAKHVDPRTFEVPGTDGRAYVYVGPAGRGGILLHGAPNGPDGRICVLTTELRPDRLTEEDLARRLGR